MPVRRAIAADVPELVALLADYWAFEGIPGFETARLEALLASLLRQPALGRCWVLTQGARLEGYLVVTHVFSLEHGGVMAEVDELYLRADARARGGGAELLVAAEQALAAEGCPRLQLQLGASNERARAFYQRHGYQRRAGYELWDKPLTVAGAAGSER